jgi:hypothetical protein
LRLVYILADRLHGHLAVHNSTGARFKPACRHDPSSRGLGTGDIVFSSSNRLGTACRQLRLMLAARRNGCPNPIRTAKNRFGRRAYELWQQAGRPDGRHDELWHQASAEGAGQTLADAGFFDEAPRRTSKRLLPHRQKVDGKPTLKSLHRSAEGFTS